MLRTYTETYDVNTADGKPTLIGFHTPIGRNPYHFLYPAFMMYEKYKYLGCDISIVNSAHLPISITAYDIEGGQANMDPRDSLNPILFKGCHGNSLGGVLNSIYQGMSELTRLSALDKEELVAAFNNYYYTALGDNGWRKSPINKTLRINGLHPLVYRMAANIQMSPVNQEDIEYYENSNLSAGNDPYTDTDTDGTINDHRWVRGSDSAGPTTGNIMYGPGLESFRPSESNTAVMYGTPYSMFTNGVQSLGWMDTLSRVNGENSTVVESQPAGINAGAFSANKIAMLPKVFMGVLLIPPAYRAYNFLRISIRHKFAFKGIRGISAGAGDPVFDPAVNSYGYRNEYDSGVVPTKEIAAVKSAASVVLEPPYIPKDVPSDSSFETISDDNIELINAKTA